MRLKNHTTVKNKVIDKTDVTGLTSKLIPTIRFRKAFAQLASVLAYAGYLSIGCERHG